MKMSKFAVAAACGLLVFGAYAQSSGGKSETSIEETYLREAIDDTIVTELAHNDERDNKELALKYLEEACASGSLSPEKHAALVSLAGEGVTSQSRMNGRMMNNFPDIRSRACELLAKVPTEQSKDALKEIALKDNEPMVISAAIRGLGEVGINNKDEVVNAIAWAEKKLQVLNPTSSLAFDVLEAYEKLAGTVEDNRVMIDSVAKIASNYRYVSPVREKAKALLKKLQSGK